jgi:signal transduction histidine kinase
MTGLLALVVLPLTLALLSLQVFLVVQKMSLVCIEEVFAKSIELESCDRAYA